MKLKDHEWIDPPGKDVEINWESTRLTGGILGYFARWFWDFLEWLTEVWEWLNEVR